MNVRDSYNTWAASYDTDRNLTRDLDERVTHAIMDGMSPRTVLEIGCGTGKNTVFLAQLAERVHAVDFSEPMIRRAQEKVGQGNVSFTVADLTRPWPFAGEVADLVVCNLVLEHIADLPFIFGEAARCLATPGRFFVCELHPFKQYRGTKARLEQDGERVEVPAFVHHISEFVQAAEGAGFRLGGLNEWWHDEDEQAPPRLLSFLFEK